MYLETKFQTLKSISDVNGEVRIIHPYGTFYGNLELDDVTFFIVNPSHNNKRSNLHFTTEDVIYIDNRTINLQ